MGVVAVQAQPFLPRSGGVIGVSRKEVIRVAAGTVGGRLIARVFVGDTLRPFIPVKLGRKVVVGA